MSKTVGSEPVKYEEIIEMLADNYMAVEQSIANQILLKVANHYPTQGSYRENVWKSLFEMTVPKKYCIEQGVFIIDSYGNHSKEVDLVIFDEMYTPYIFNYGEIKFIPIEAVAAVVQCKSSKVAYEEVSNWRMSIEKLFTSMDSVARIISYMADNNEVKEKSVTQTATRPIMIFCAIEPVNPISRLRNDFDIVLSVCQEKKKIHKYIRGESNSLTEWNDSLNHALKINAFDKQEIRDEKEKRSGLKKSTPLKQREKILLELKVEQRNKEGELEENVLLSLIFQLNQLLMILNNPMLFPHHAYASRFRDILKAKKDGS